MYVRETRDACVCVMWMVWRKWCRQSNARFEQVRQVENMVSVGRKVLGHLASLMEGMRAQTVT